MSKLTDYLSNFLPFPQEDKRYIKERSDELVTSFLIKNALKKGTYLSKELEHQNLNERVQFRASRDHAVILGTMLKRVSQNRNKLSFCHPERSEGSRIHKLMHTRFFAIETPSKKTC